MKPSTSLHRTMVVALLGAGFFTACTSDPVAGTSEADASLGSSLRGADASVSVIARELCGNGRVDPGESCDDGNQVSGDGCRSNCTLEPHAVCFTPGQTCTFVATCGDGKRDPSEECDLGNNDGRYGGCSPNCTLAPHCGDGIVQSEYEACDDGNLVDGDGCSLTCAIDPCWACGCPGVQPCTTIPLCGNGKVEGGEMCDDGNTQSGDGCSGTCSDEAGWTCAGPGRPCMPRCGDGIVAGTEECDTGEANGSGGCSSSCTLPRGDAGSPVGDGAVYPMVVDDQGRSVIEPLYVERHFNELMGGTWLIGWFGGINHFSWLRISNEAATAGGGRIQVLSNPNVPANVAVPYWNCSGAGTWTITQRPATLGLDAMPGGCANEVLNFESIWPDSTQGRAVLQAKLTAGRIADGGGYDGWQSLSAYKYPDDMCNADFTACSVPF